MFRLHFLLQLVTLIYLIAIPTLAFSQTSCNPREKKALLQIKKELGNPQELSSWDPITDCCNQTWQGVFCEIIQTQTRVNHLDLFDLNLRQSYPIPPSIANLPYLDFLSFYRIPNLAGPIPPTITKLTKLRYLTVGYTNVSGQIPNFLAQIKTLVNINLFNNKLSGPLPDSLSSLPNLEGITFEDNRLTGSIPESYGSFSKRLTSLRLSRNRLSGKIPASLAKLNLEVVEMSGNMLEGDASVLFKSEKQSRVLLARNFLEFDIGKVKLCKELEELDVSKNGIYGTLPRELTALKSLERLNVSYNNLCGKIPEGGRVQWFGVSSFYHNKCLCGSPLPPCKS
ncbi:hypothetical protein VNO77_01866 [Canavalia gladiata]|uniref:Leucine-rich repeat-containing N-terminal plant-type domain-containing protein n=1 Tax=Canavalia gladiata TaxID=3824 RepID=A0AAN9RAQ0_CANGL